VRPEKLDRAWARANLVKVWRAQAPRRVLAAFDAAHPQPARRATRSRPARSRRAK
jgi:hypothetical protein